MHTMNIHIQSPVLYYASSMNELSAIIERGRKWKIYTNDNTAYEIDIIIL